MGFLAPTAFAKQVQPIPMLPACGLCGLDKKCKSPRMEVSGEGRLKTLIIGEAPGWNEDEQGRQFVGNAGGKLLEMLNMIGVNLRRDCWLFNALSCRPFTSDDKNRTPEGEEIDHCRPRVVKIVQGLQPERIILLGKHAVRSLMYWIWKDDSGEYSGEGEMARWAGWRIPSTKLNAWVCPTYHPSFVIQNLPRNKGTQMIVTEHLRDAFVLSGRPHKIVPDYAKQVRVELDPERAGRALLQTFGAGSNWPLAFDFETDRLKPDSKDSKILCCSFSNGTLSIAFPWSGLAIKATKILIQDPKIPKITAGHFEERWCWRHLGCGIRNWQSNTLIQAHHDRCQRGICGVKFQAFVRLGVPFYARHLEQLMDTGSKDSNSPNRLGEADITDLCRYCGLDSLYEWLIADDMRRKDRK